MSLDFKNLIVDSIEILPGRESSQNSSVKFIMSNILFRIHFKYQPFFLVIEYPSSADPTDNGDGITIDDIEKRIIHIGPTVNGDEMALQITFDDGTHIDSNSFRCSQHALYKFNLVQIYSPLENYDEYKRGNIQLIRKSKTQDSLGILFHTEDNHWDIMIRAFHEYINTHIKNMLRVEMEWLNNSSAFGDSTSLKKLREKVRWGFLYEP